MREIFTAFLFMMATNWAWASCPSVPVPPMTVYVPAEEYASTGGFSLDSDGILVFDYGREYNNLGKYRNPYFISNYAGALYRDYLASGCQEEELKRKFLLQAAWLLKSGEWRGNIMVWSYPFPQPIFGSSAGWISGIAQSPIAGIMQRAFVMTGDSKFHVAAEAAMRAYQTDIRNGGVVTKDGAVTWVEEVADPAGRSFKILNGHITALGGILDFYHVTREEEWKTVFDRGVAAVKRDLPKYDAGFTSWYSQDGVEGREIAARKDYNTLHVSQLLWLYEITGDSDFLRYASHFQAYDMNSDIYTALGSTDEKGHGPDQAKGTFGNAYWSHSQFPTWLEVTPPQSDVFKAFSVFGPRKVDAAFPKDFLLMARHQGEWKLLKVIEGNSARDVEIKFVPPVTADAFRLEILSDNGNHNVALQAAIPIRENFIYGPITNDCNYRTGTDYNFDRALDDDQSSSMTVNCAGWVVLPMEGASTIEVAGEGNDSAKFRLAYSDNMKDWDEFTEVPVSAAGKAITLAPHKFVRISFERDVRNINKLILR